MRSQYWRIVIFSTTISLLALYFSWWTEMINNPDQHNATDFISYYAVGRIAQSVGFSSIYDIASQQHFEEAVVGVPLRSGQVLLFIHPPQLVPLLTLIIDGNYVRAFIYWTLILLVVILGTAHFLVNSLYTTENNSIKLMSAAGIISFYPLFISLWQGQDTAFLLLGVAFWCVGMLKKQDTFTITGLLLTTIRPHICIILALPLFLKYRHILWRFTKIVTIPALAYIVALTPKGVFDFINLLRISANGEWFGIKPEVMLNALGLIVRSASFLTPQEYSITVWIIYGIALGIIVVLWTRSKHTIEQLLGLTILVSVIAAPHLHIHDLALLIVPLLLIDKSGALKIKEPALPLVVVSVIFFIRSLVENLYFVLPYLVYLLMLWYLLRPITSTNIRTALE